MLVRNERDRRGLLAIGKIVATALEELSRSARPGLTTGELDALAGRLLAEAGASSTPAREFGFPGAMCISVNDEVVHGVPGGRLLRTGDLVKLDLTADRDGFVADATRMVVLEPAAENARRLAECARRACHAAVAAARAGVRLSSLGALIHAEADRDGFCVVKELCGHGVGRRTHERPEVPNYNDLDNASVLREGMVIAIEPIISTGACRILEMEDGWTVTTADGALAGHYEETIIVGPDGAEVATVC